MLILGTYKRLSVCSSFLFGRAAGRSQTAAALVVSESERVREPNNRGSSSDPRECSAAQIRLILDSYLRNLRNLKLSSPPATALAR